ncbi:MAG: hypothetical protein ACXAEU_09400 [Candidatus Hodarchaeales archaeon]|jgi:hypothetical protein
MVCDIVECDEDHSRTLSKVKIGDALTKESLTVKKEAKGKKGRSKGSKVKLCKDHYRRVKKHIKKKESIERLRWR